MQEELVERQPDLCRDERDDVPLDAQAPLVVAQVEERLRRARDEDELALERRVPIRQLVLVLEALVEPLERRRVPEDVGLLGDLDATDGLGLHQQRPADVARELAAPQLALTAPRELLRERLDGLEALAERLLEVIEHDVLREHVRHHLQAREVDRADRRGAVRQRRRPFGRLRVDHERELVAPGRLEGLGDQRRQVPQEARLFDRAHATEDDDPVPEDHRHASRARFDDQGLRGQPVGLERARVDALSEVEGADTDAVEGEERDPHDQEVARLPLADKAPRSIADARCSTTIAYAVGVKHLVVPSLVVLALMWLTIPRAHACSCASPAPTRRVLPTDGATNVPVDAMLRVFLEGFAEPIRALVGQEYRLRNEHGIDVPLRRAVVRTRIDLAPTEPLTPGGRYVLEQLFAYDEDGTRLADHERGRPGPPVRAVWYPIARFTTAATPISARSLRPRITRTALYRAFGGGDCGPATTLGVELDPSVDAHPTDVVELRVTGQGVVATAPLDGLESLGAGDDLCAYDPITLQRGNTVRFELVYLDAAGRSLGTARGRVSTQARPESTARERTYGWRAPIVTATTEATVAPSGPQGCEFGVDMETNGLAHGDPTSDAVRDTALLASGGGRWLFVPGSPGHPRLRAYSWVRGAPLAHALDEEVWVEASTASPSGPIMVVSERGSPSATASTRRASTLELRAFTPRLGTRWRRPLPEGHEYALAYGDGRLLITWVERASSGARLSYALLDERTGEGEPRSTSIAVEPYGSAPRPVFVDGRFLVFWRPTLRDGLRVSTLERDGFGPALTELPRDDSTDYDLMSVAGRVALVNARHGAVRLTILDRDGRVTGAPVELSRGVGGRQNARPRIAWAGRFFAVTWETFPESGVFVTVVDREGRVAPPTQLDAADHRAIVGLVVERSEPWIAYTSGRRGVRLARLVCRSAPQSGAQPVLLGLPPLEPTARPMYEAPMDETDLIPASERQLRAPPRPTPPQTPTR